MRGASPTLRNEPHIDKVVNLLSEMCSFMSLRAFLHQKPYDVEMLGVFVCVFVHVQSASIKLSPKHDSVM